ncbi:MAG: TolC family protein [Bacteroidales bacterium]
MLHTHHATRRPLRPEILILLTLLAPATAFAQTAQTTATPPKSVLTKEQAIDLALTHNQSMRASRLTVAQSQAGEVTAALKPNPVFTSTNSDFPVFAPGQLTFSNASTNQTFTQALTYLFERGGKRDRRIQVARDTTEMTARTVDDTERQLRFQVGQAFVNVLLAKANLEAARADLRDFGQTVDLSRRRVAGGDLAEGDYLKIALQKLQFEQDESAAEIALVQGKAALRQLVGYDAVREDFDVAGTLEHRKATVTLDALQQQALAARPDLQAAGASTKLAASTVALARSNRAVDITGEVEYDRNGPVNGVGFGLSLPIPIHDRNQGEIARSQVALSQASESEAAARVAVLTDVANAYAAFESNEKVVSLYESGYLAQAQQSRDISRYAFTKGATGLLDLLDAERTYRATQLAYRQALAAHLTSIEQLNFAVGKQVIP